MNILKRITTSIFVLLVGLTLFFFIYDDDSGITEQLTPSEILSFTSWVTTNALNNKVQNVALTDTNVSNFVGYAYFKKDGTFTMFKPVVHLGNINF